MKEIVCLSNEPWSTAPGRTQQLVSRLRDTRVLYFYPAFPQSLDWRRPGRKVRPNVTVFALPPVPEWTLRFPHLFLFAQHRLARLISGQVQRRRFRAPLLWTSHPAHVHLLDQLEYDGLVYDCDREWGRLPSRWEGALAHAADVVFAASPGLRQRLSPCSENIALLPNGVSFPLFSRGDLGGTQPLFPGLRGPLLGWAGTLHADLDLSPLLYAARSCPDWTFLLLGRQEEGSPWPDRLRRLPNVILRGPCPLLDVPGYLYRCDVLLNFLRAPQDHSDIVPVRLYEYLSTGKPVVSMLWPGQVEQFPDVVYGAYSPEELVGMCVQALREDRDWVAGRRRDYGRAAAWSARSGEVARILETAGLL